jgi:FtsP/CotA-like multicopper oxidase with cupredoxin domain
MDVIAAGGSFDYHYPNDQDAATLWYHDHAHGRTSRTLYYGLLAMYVLEDELEDELGLPQGEYDVPIAIADHAFNKDGSFRYEENVDFGFRGDTILVNGAVSPRMAVQRRKYRLRFLNASNARSYTLRLGGGETMTQIAGDGGLLERPVGRDRFEFHPAERIDLVLDFSRYAPGEQLVLHNEDGSGGAVAVMRFDIVDGGGIEDFRVPSRLRRLEPLPPVNARRRWDLALGTSMWQISGKGFDPNRIDARPRLGSTEEWTFVNHSNRVHPMHLHGFQFRVLERSSGPVEAADRLGWKDTVGVHPNETVKVLAWFAPYAGKYVFHCHSLEHADKAMMLQMEVVK